jgi:ATP-dependent Clp protease ATP-binding subunit ClpB
MMQREIDDSLAQAILAGNVRDGDTVRVDLAPDREHLTVASAPQLLDED